MKSFVSRKSILKNLSTLYLILLFPGFFFYHYAVARAYIPPVLGGYFSFMAISATPFFLLLGIKSSFIRVNHITIIFFIIMLIIVIIATVNLYFGTPVQLNKEMFNWSLIGVVLNLVMYMIGRYLDVEKTSLYSLMLLFLILEIEEYFM